MIYKPTKEEEESDRIGCGCICSVLVATIIPGIILIVAEQRDEFLKYNEQLVKDYLMIE